MGGAAKDLADSVAGIRFDGLRQDVVRESKRVLLDSIGIPLFF